MSHHFRSVSELQQTPASAFVQQQEQQVTNSFIRTYTDSQQSLDQLFNPVQSTVPLKDRQLPKSFFDPGFRQQNNSSNGSNNNNNTSDVSGDSTNTNVTSQQHNFHSRSLSYGDQRPVVVGNGRHNFHIRTTSTLAPMPVLASSNHSSHEALDTDMANNSYLEAQTQQQAQQQNWSANSMEDLDAIPSSVNNSIVSSGCQSMTQQFPTYAPQVHQPNAGTMEPIDQNRNHHSHHHGPQQVPIQQSSVGYVQQPMTMTNSSMNPGVPNMHSRSMSFNPNHAVRQVTQQNFHMRTHSTVVPPHQPANITPINQHHHHSHQSSHEFLNHNNSSSCVISSTDGCSSSGYSTDDMTNTTCWSSIGHQQQTPTSASQQQQSNAQGIEQTTHQVYL